MSFGLFCFFFFSLESDEPRIEITSPSNILAVGAAVNLTCTAWQADSHKSENAKPYLIEWFGPQDERFGDKCKAGSPRAARMSCTVTVSALTNKTFGIYTCRARTYNEHCTTKIIDLHGK